MISTVQLRGTLLGTAVLLFALNVLSVLTRPPDEIVAVPSPVDQSTIVTERAEQSSDPIALVLTRVIPDGSDSWRPMRLALEYARAHGDDKLYGVFFEEKVKFQYPPTALLIMDLFETFLGKTGTSDAFLNSFSIAFFLLGTILVWRICVVLLARCTQPSFRLSLLDHALLLVLALMTYPTLKALALGQIQTWLNAAFFGAVLLLILDRKAWSGVLTALICLVKPQLALFLLWAVIRREWTFAKSMFLTGAACGLVGLVVYGWQSHLDYLNVLSFLSEHGESYYLNQSMNGFMLRLLDIGPNAVDGSDGWVGGSSFPPYHPGVYFASMAMTLTLILWALVSFKMYAPSQDRTLDFCQAAVCFTLASPIAWIHHYGPMLAAYAVAFPLLARQPSRRITIAMLLCWIAIAVPFPVTKLVAGTALNFIQSHAFFGALGLLICLHFLRAKEESSPGNRHISMRTNQ